MHITKDTYYVSRYDIDTYYVSKCNIVKHKYYTLHVDIDILTSNVNFKKQGMLYIL